ncbi:MAG: hypothetical protein ACI9UA_001248 [Pseudoalteromonas tetraodonis]|jgi:hypothetical protein
MLPSKTWQRSLLGLAFFIALYIAYWVVYHISPEAHAYWISGEGIRGAEDRTYEWFGFIGFFGAGVFSLLTLLYRDKMPNKKVALFFLGMGLFFIVCAGEEISWGQRVFGWETPENYAKMNEQGETNLHNLKTLPVHPKDIVSWFMKLFGIGLPIIFYFVFKKRAHWLHRCVAPLSMVPLFIYVEIFNKLEKPIEPLIDEKYGRAAKLLVRRQHEEIMEMYWGLCVLFAAVGLFLIWRRLGSTNRE